MKEITCMSDLVYIVQNRLDVKDSKGYRVDFVRLLAMPLIDILNIFGQGWYYEGK